MKLYHNRYLAGLLKRGVILFGVLASMIPWTSRAASWTWQGDSGNNWNNTGNWGGSFPNAAGDTVNFGNVSGRTPTINTAVQVGYFNITTSSAYTFNASSVLTLNVNSGNAGISVSSGTHTFGGSGGLTLADTTDINIAAGTLTISSPLNASLGTGTAFNKLGAGTLSLSGNKDFTGNINLNAGILLVSGDGSLGQAQNDIAFNGGTLQTSAEFTLGSSRVLNFTGNGIINNAGNFIMNSSGLLAGSGNMTKAGAGNMTISGSNSGYTGNITVSSGTLTLGTSSALGAVSSISLTGGTLTLANSEAINNAAAITLSSGRTFNLANNNETIGTLNGSGTATVALGTGDLTVSAGTYTGLFTGTSGAVLNKTGPGTLTLGGNSSGFTGDINITGGTLGISADNNLGVAANPVSINGGALNVSTTFTSASARVFSVGSSGGTIDVDSGDIFSLGAANAIRGSGNFAKTGAGELTLGFANNTAGGFSGTFAVNAGQVNLNATNALGLVNSVTVTSGTLLLGASQTIRDGANLTVGSGGTVNLNNNSETIANLSMTSGSVTTGTGVLTVAGDITGNNAATSATIAGKMNLGSGVKTFNIDNGVAATDMLVSAELSGTGAQLKKTGTGTLNVSAANSYSGGTVVDGGVLVMADRQALGTGTLTINNGAEVQAAFGNASPAAIGDITVNGGAIRRTANNGLPTQMLNSGATSLTINGNTSLIDQGGDGAGGYLGFNGPIYLNSGNLTLDAVGVNDEVILDLTEDLNIPAGSTLATTGAGTKTINARPLVYLVGNGTASTGTESVFQIGANTSVSLDVMLKVNGSGLGGLRVEGSNADVGAFLDPMRMWLLEGSGGALTIALNGTGDYTVDSAPFFPSDVKLGLDNVAGSTPIYILGVSDDDLQNFGGLVVKGGTVSMGANQRFLGTSAPTTLDITGGTLELSAGVDQTTLEFTGRISLTGGVIDGGGAGGTKGILKTSGDVYSDGTTVLYNPNLVMSPNSGTSILGGSSPLTGTASLGDFEKTGAGTVRVDLAVNANTISINQGTLLLGASDVLGNGSAMTLAGGTFASGGFNETLGTLTLANNSYIDLGTSSSVVHFADTHGISWAGGNLTIRDWSGLNTGGGTDQLYFGSNNSGLTQNQVDQIKFENPAGYAPGIYDAMILPTGEVVPIPVPVPEPKTVAAFSFILVLICYRERQWLTRWVKKFKKVDNR